MRNKFIINFINKEAPDIALIDFGCKNNLNDLLEICDKTPIDTSNLIAYPKFEFKNKFKIKLEELNLVKIALYEEQLLKIIKDYHKKGKKVGIFFSCLMYKYNWADFPFKIIKNCDYVFISEYFDGFTKDIKQGDLFRLINQCDKNQTLDVLQNIQNKNMLSIQQYLLKYGEENWNEENYFTFPWKEITFELTNLGFKKIKENFYINKKINEKLKNELDIDLKNYAYATNCEIIYSKILLSKTAKEGSFFIFL